MGRYFGRQESEAAAVCVFTNEEQVTRFQDAAGSETELFGFDYIELQPEALKQLKKAREEAQKKV